MALEIPLHEPYERLPVHGIFVASDKLRTS
jgi:hypothetical protein